MRYKVIALLVSLQPVGRPVSWVIEPGCGSLCWRWGEQGASSRLLLGEKSLQLMDPNMGHTPLTQWDSSPNFFQLLGTGVGEIKDGCLPNHVGPHLCASWIGDETDARQQLILDKLDMRTWPRTTGSDSGSLWLQPVSRRFWEIWASNWSGWNPVSLCAASMAGSVVKGGQNGRLGQALVFWFFQQRELLSRDVLHGLVVENHSPMQSILRNAVILSFLLLLRLILLLLLLLLQVLLQSLLQLLLFSVTIPSDRARPNSGGPNYRWQFLSNLFPFVFWSVKWNNNATVSVARRCSEFGGRVLRALENLMVLSNIRGYCYGWPAHLGKKHLRCLMARWKMCALSPKTPNFFPVNFHWRIQSWVNCRPIWTKRPVNVSHLSWVSKF